MIHYYIKKHIFRIFAFVISVFIPASLIFVFFTLCEKTQKQAKEQHCSIRLDISKHQNWLDVYREFVKSGLHIANEADIILYNPYTNECIKHVHRYYENTPKGNKASWQNIVLNFKRGGLWVHHVLTDDYIPILGQYPNVFHLYPAERKESFIKWEQFPSFVRNFTRSNENTSCFVIVNMDYDCSLTDLFAQYKLLFEHFPQDWHLGISLYPGPYIPYSVNDSVFDKTDNETDILLENLIKVLHAHGNEEENAQRYKEICFKLIETYNPNNKDAKNSFSMYAKLLINADNNTTNTIISNLNSKLLPPLYE